MVRLTFSQHTYNEYLPCAKPWVSRMGWDAALS